LAIIYLILNVNGLVLKPKAMRQLPTAKL